MPDAPADVVPSDVAPADAAAADVAPADVAPAASLATSLVAWYATSRRRLPWRDDPTPYKVLLSELMLQQTRVETVLPYFARFVDRWPSLEALAGAPEDEVVREWSGLGYYSRARNLHKAVREAASRGGLPADYDALRELPGLGPYTAGAVASIAFGVAVPAVDGNVERVISRVDGRTEDPKSRVGAAAIAARARALLDGLPAGVPAGDLNQALMELGATVCAPRNPACGRCPWASACVARASGDPEALPVKKKKAAPKPMRAVAGLLWRDGRVLMGRRPPGLLGGLYEPVSLETDEEGPVAVRKAFARVGLDVSVGRPLGEVVHVFTHRRLVLAVWSVGLGVGRASAEPRAVEHYEDVRFVDPDAPDVALSTLARKTVAVGGALFRG